MRRWSKNQSSFTLWFWAVGKRRWSWCVSEKERQCKFPLACILRQSWQAEVITERLTHQHGENLSPPGREIAKSQFTHIQLPARAWSHWCEATTGRHPDTADIPVHATIHMLSKLCCAACSHRPQPASVFLFYTWAYVFPHAMNKPSFPVKHTFSNHQSTQNDNIRQVCVREAEKRRESEKQMTPA